MPKLKPAFIILAVTSEGTEPAKYYNYGELPVFDTEELAKGAIPQIAGSYYERGNVPTFVIAPCLTPVN